MARDRARPYAKDDNVIIVLYWVRNHAKPHVFVYTALHNASKLVWIDIVAQKKGLMQFDTFLYMPIKKILSLLNFK